MKKLFWLLQLLLSIQVYAQQTAPLPLDAYGVWERGNKIPTNPDDPDFDFLKGFRMDRMWMEIQPSGPDEYDWTAFKNMLKIAINKNKYVYTNILVGPECPAWIYNNGVDKVLTESDKFNGEFPYYLDEDYKRYFFNLVENYGSFLRDSLTQTERERVMFVQVMAGCSGDETPYKGEQILSDPNHFITDAQWKAFRLETFEKFKNAFLDGDQTTCIPLLFNDIDPAAGEEDEWNWVLNNVGSKFGIKGSAYVRGHHLSKEKIFKEQWDTYLVNPTDLQLFSRAEMDQTYNKPLFLINQKLGFYWGVLSGLNTGLAVWDLSSGALEAGTIGAEKTDIMESLQFFNKYAGQIFPAQATAAYCIFHEGLNSANSIKFPEATYGVVDKTNKSRYEAICRAYASRGAKMDDVRAATRGQVFQRDKQTGYNDAGWEIHEGNYERFIEQINPDQTSIALWRVNGNIDATSSKYDRFARSFENSTGKNTMYFRFHQDLWEEEKPDSLIFSVTWLDKNNGSSWDFKYSNGSGESITAKSITGQGSGEWITEKIVVNSVNMNRDGANGSDFTIVNTDNQDDIFHGVQVDIMRKRPDFIKITAPSCGSSHILGADVVVSVEAHDNDGIDKVKFELDHNGEWINCSNAPYKHTFNNLTTGQHTIAVKMKDLSGNVINAEEITINIESSGDNVSITSPSTGELFSVDQAITVEATGFDQDGIEKIQFGIDSNDSFADVFSPPYTHTYNDLAVGNHILKVKMQDRLGNVVIGESVSITVLPAQDTVMIQSPIEGQLFDYGTSINVVANGFTVDGIGKIRFRVDGGEYNNIESAPYEYTFHNLAEGDHFIEAQMKTLGGNRVLTGVNITIATVTTGVDEVSEPKDNGIIYPTVTQNSINWDKSIQAKRLIVYNIAGVVKRDIIIDGQGSIDVSNLAQGIYLVRIIKKSGEQVVQRILKR